MKQILAVLRMDARLIFSDRILWYVLVFPAVMGVILILVSGRLGDDIPTWAVSADLPQTAMDSLERAANLEIQTDHSSLIRRVNAFDRVAGVTWEAGAARVYFQGNEGEAYQNQTAALIEAVLNGGLPAVPSADASVSKDGIVPLMMAALLLAPSLVGGTVSGFLIVSEKENQLIRAYQIAPIRASSYIGARSLLAAVIGVISMVILCLLFGAAGKIGALLLILLCSLPLFGVVTILFGSTAKDKMAGIALFKILAMVFLVLPLASAFVPAGLRGVFYPLPMYWQFQAVLQVLNGGLNLRYCAITFATGLTLLLILIAASLPVKRPLKLRGGKEE